MAIPTHYHELVESLAIKTDLGQVNWKFDGHQVEVVLDEDRLQLWSGNDERTDEGFVSFALKNKRAEPIDNWYLDASDRDYDLMLRLYLSAKRHALGIPDRLARIRNLLETDGKIGE